MADTDDPDLRERVAELEATVEAQQATIQQLLPSRRRVLQAGGLLAGGGVLGALSADRASADVTGQVGTQQDRVDVFAGDVDANSVNTDEATINNITLTESTVSSLTEFQSDTVSVAGGSFESIFDVTNSIDVLGGTIQGRNVRELRITWDSGTTDTIYPDSNRATDDTGDRFTVLFCPALRDVTQVEFRNGSGTSSEFGYSILTI